VVLRLPAAPTDPPDNPEVPHEDDRSLPPGGRRLTRPGFFDSHPFEHGSGAARPETIFDPEF
jgi:hypothetical protein